MGRIRFETQRQACRFLDPTRDFEPTEKVTEIRTDPLTGRTSRILEMGFAPAKPDVEKMVEVGSLHRGKNVRHCAHGVVVG